MINKIIDEALIVHNFTKEHATDLTRFYIREEGSSIRFAILHKLDELLSPADLNAVINQSTPKSFLTHPTFKKNCDLICIHQMKKLAEFKNYEEQIFAIEEDPHFFKKYVLYYSETEEVAVQDYTFTKLRDTISDKSLFNTYKDDPLAATQYSVAAKIFIKLPFLELPYTRRDLVSLRLQAGEAVSEAGLDETYATIQKIDANNADELIKELIKYELENNSN